MCRGFKTGPLAGKLDCQRQACFNRFMRGGVGDITGMAVLVRVVEKGSFSAAAQAIGLTPSAVSKQVSRIEAELGVRLINRSTHELSLTEAGKIYHERCLRILRDIDLARDAVQETAAGLSGTLKLHLTPGTGRQFVLPSLRRFVQQHPNLTLDLTIAPEAIDIVQEGFDLAIRSGTEKDIGLGYTSVECKPLSRARYLICASRDYFKRHRRPKEPRDLAEHNCLLSVGQPSFDRWWFSDGRRRYAVTVNGHFRSNDWAAVHDAALAGLGIARLLAFAGQTGPASSGLAVIFEKEAVCDRTIWAVYPRAPNVPRKVTSFLDFLTAELKAK